MSVAETPSASLNAFSKLRVQAGFVNDENSAIAENFPALLRNERREFIRVFFQCTDLLFSIQLVIRQPWFYNASITLKFFVINGCLLNVLLQVFTLVLTHPYFNLVGDRFQANFLKL